MRIDATSCRHIYTSVLIGRNFEIKIRYYEMASPTLDKTTRNYETTSRNFKMWCQNFEIASRIFDINSRNFKTTSRNYEMWSQTFEIASRNFEMTTRNCEITSPNYEMWDDKSKFRDCKSKKGRKGQLEGRKVVRRREKDTQASPSWRSTS